jgi:hypothetical protein
MRSEWVMFCGSSVHLTMPRQPIRPAAGWRRLYRTGILVSLVLAGCTSWHPPVPVPPELTAAGVQARLRIPAEANVTLAETSVRPSQRSHPSHTQPLSGSSESEPSAFSLADALAFAQPHSPRLRSARAASARARGQQPAAFAPFVPASDLLSQSGAPSHHAGPGAPGATGFLRPRSTPGTHRYMQAERQLLWTLDDFGWRAGRYHQAAAREQIAARQLVRADQTGQFDVTAADWR